MGIFGIQFPWETPEGVGFIAPWTPKLEVLVEGEKLWIQGAGDTAQIAAGLEAAGLGPGDEVTMSNALAGPMPGPGVVTVGIGTKGTVLRKAGRDIDITPGGITYTGTKSGVLQMAKVAAAGPVAGGSQFVQPAQYPTGPGPGPAPGPGEDVGGGIPTSTGNQFLDAALGGVTGFMAGGLGGAVLGALGGYAAGRTLFPWETPAGEGFVAPWSERPGQVSPALPGAGGLPGAGVGVAYAWNTGTATFYRLTDGKIAVQRKNGTWKTYRPKKHIVVSSNPRMGTLIKATKKLNKLNARLGKIYRKKSPKAAVVTSPYLSAVERKALK